MSSSRSCSSCSPCSTFRHVWRTRVHRIKRFAEAACVSAQVPPKLKAALFSLISAFATETASAEKIWCVSLANTAAHAKPARHACIVRAQGVPRNGRCCSEAGGRSCGSAARLSSPHAGRVCGEARHALSGTLFSTRTRMTRLYASTRLAEKFACCATCHRQLNEVEARAETYVETVAFVSLVNKLLYLCETSNRGPAADAGASAAHVFQFIRDAVFANIDRCAVYQSCTPLVLSRLQRQKDAAALPKAPCTAAPQAHIQGRRRKMVAVASVSGAFQAAHSACADYASGAARSWRACARP